MQYIEDVEAQALRECSPSTSDTSLLGKALGLIAGIHSIVQVCVKMMCPVKSLFVLLKIGPISNTRFSVLVIRVFLIRACPRVAAG